jgi:AbrB family looped-hinge helix DNA binding protein
MAHKSPASQSYAIQLGARGRVVLPAAIRKALTWNPGDRLIVTLEAPGVVRLVSALQAARTGRGLLRDRSAGRQLAEELLADRRQEESGG